MKCKCCYDKIIYDKYKIKGGYICRSCFQFQSGCVRKNINNLTARQINELDKIIDPKQASPWIGYKPLQVSDYCVQMDDWEINLSDITNIYLSFHPKHQGSKSNLVMGDMTVVIELESGFVIEEVLRTLELVFCISGKKIYYKYPEEIEELIYQLKSNINKGIYNTDNIRDYYHKKDQEKEKEEQRRREQAEKTRKAQEDRRRREQERKEQERRQQSSYSKQNSYNKQKAKGDNGCFDDELDKAKRLYKVGTSFTIKEIKKIRNELVKKYHPDQGGSAEKCKEVNKAFDILMKYAAA